MSASDPRDGGEQINLCSNVHVMETETVVMTSRRRMVMKPMSLADTQLCKKQNSSDDNNDTADNTPIKPPPPAVTLVSPVSEKKKLLLQESSEHAAVAPTVQQRNKVLLSCTIGKDLSDTDDSDSDDSTTGGDKPAAAPSDDNRRLYYSAVLFLTWAAVQYWMIAVAGFGAVFFAVSALIAIYFNTNTGEKRDVLSAYSVFNPQCTPIQGSADPKQLERELIMGGGL